MKSQGAGLHRCVYKKLGFHLKSNRELLKSYGREAIGGLICNFFLLNTIFFKRYLFTFICLCQRIAHTLRVCVSMQHRHYTQHIHYVPVLACSTHMWCLWRSEGSFGSLPAGVVGVVVVSCQTQCQEQTRKAVSTRTCLSASLDRLFLNKKEKRVLISLIALSWIKSYFHKMFNL